MFRILELAVGHDSVKYCVPTSIRRKLGGHHTGSDAATEEAPVWTRRDSTHTSSNCYSKSRHSDVAMIPSKTFSHCVYYLLQP